jgi:hypothetical protein
MKTTRQAAVNQLIERDIKRLIRNRRQNRSAVLFITADMWNACYQPLSFFQDSDQPIGIVLVFEGDAYKWCVVDHWSKQRTAYSTFPFGVAAQPTEVNTELTF